MPTWAFTPESMCEIRCGSGCSTEMTTPGTCGEFFADLVENLLAACGRESGSKLTMISETFTPSACSSSSARPVRRPKAATPSLILLQPLVDHAGDAVRRFRATCRAEAAR